MTDPVHFSPGPLPIGSAERRHSRRRRAADCESPSRSGRSVLIADTRRGSRHQAREGVDELACFVEIELVLRVIRQADLHGGSTQQVHGDRVDHLRRPGTSAMSRASSSASAPTHFLRPQTHPLLVLCGLRAPDPRKRNDGEIPPADRISRLAGSVAPRRSLRKQHPVARVFGGLPWNFASLSCLQFRLRSHN